MLYSDNVSKEIFEIDYKEINDRSDEFSEAFGLWDCL